MKWVVGIDLVEGNEGPLQFASWLSRFSTGEGGEEIVAAHVVPAKAQIDAFMSSEELEKLHPRAKAACEAAIKKADATEVVSSIELVESADIEAALGATAKGEGADALVVGRRAKRGEDKLSRLGRVSRRVLRQLPTPVVVVPPDFDAREPRDGPVILATACTELSVPAGKFAEAVARRLDCDLLVAHVVRTVDWAVAYLPVDAVEQVRSSSQEIGRKDLASWAQRHELWGAQTAILHGDPSQAIADLAREKNASLVVTGSRELSGAARMFVPSVGSELAASCWTPVAVVPPR